MVIEVCAAVIRREGRVLVRRRPRGSHLAGTWEFPGGKRRRGERGRRCAERETEEETGLRVRAGAEIARVRHDYPGRKVLLRFFEAEAVGGRLRGGPGLRWITPAALARMPIPDANRPLVRSLRAAAPRAIPPRGSRSRPPSARGTPRRRRKAT